jgi:arylsulfatase A-like enzyme
MLGKWHLGYFSPLFLPTSRGFDSWTGYSNGETYYWSKKSPDYPKHNDLLQSNTSCYTPYNEEDKNDYSTTFYTNKAINIIKNHNSNDNIPLFLYLAYQSVHDPFDDYGNYENGIPDSYFDDNLSILTTIRKNIVGKIRQEYAKSLYLLDKGVGQIYDALNDKGILDNTYIIFMSDNGGCWYGGGRNGPLRGSKGSLFEGGIKVTSFIYGSNLKQKGITYDGLMHISDWFPTILALANIDYTPDDDFSLDGVNQVDGWLGKSVPRTSMLYNMYIKLTDYNFNIWTNGSFAVRDDKYKLMHTYDDHSYGAWFDIDTEVLDDDELDSGDRCAQQFVTGSFTYWLFDLVDDPYETTNIYSSTNQLHTLAKEKLYTLIPRYMEKATQKISIELSSKAEVVWKEADNNIVPWANIEKLQNTDINYPILCL